MMAFLARQRWWAGRVAVLPVHLLGFALAVFFLVRLIPGDPVVTLLGGQNATPETIEAARESLGLSGSIVEQLGAYFGNLLTLDFGNSMITGQPVWETMTTRLFETIELAVVASLGTILLTLAIGFLVVMKPRNPVSRVLLAYTRSAGAVPDFVLGVVGIFLFYKVLAVAPAPLGRYDPQLLAPPDLTGFPILDAMLSGDVVLLQSMASHLLLPLLVLVLAYTPLLLKLFVRALDDAVDSAPTRFRVASGGSRRAVLLSVARRAAPPAVAMFGTLFGYLLGGAVVVEQLFSMPGMGQFGVNAVNTSDLVSLQGFLLLVAALSLVVFLLVDIVTMLLDPRRRPGRGGEGAA